MSDSSLSAASGYAEASGLPNEMGLIKNRYIGRTFIQPSQSMREKGVRMKLSSVSGIVSGQRVVLIDDSIVRGTTSLRIVRLLREAGATEVHVRIASPPMIKNPCFYGVDTSTYEELLCARMSVPEACEYIESRFAGLPLARCLAEGGQSLRVVHGLLHGQLSDVALRDDRGGEQKRKMLNKPLRFRSAVSGKNLSCMRISKTWWVEIPANVR